MAKSKNDIQETSVKTKPKKTKKVETLEPKVETLDDVKVNDVQVVDDNVKIDVEIDLRSYHHSDVVNGYIRRKRSI